jgi:hypothetical protein
MRIPKEQWIIYRVPDESHKFTEPNSDVVSNPLKIRTKVDSVKKNYVI